jgi:hypothetical protein
MARKPLESLKTDSEMAPAHRRFRGASGAKKPVFQRGGDEVGKMEDKLGGLDAAREALALRQAKACQGFARTQRKETGLKPLITQETAK